MKQENIIPLFPNDIGNCACVDVDRLVKETFSDDFLFKCIAICVIAQEKDAVKQQQMLDDFVKDCENFNRRKLNETIND